MFPNSHPVAYPAAVRTSTTTFLPYLHDSLFRKRETRSEVETVDSLAAAVTYLPYDGVLLDPDFQFEGGAKARSLPREGSGEVSTHRSRISSVVTSATSLSSSR